MAALDREIELDSGAAVRVAQDLDLGLGGSVWDASIVLAKYLDHIQLDGLMYPTALGAGVGGDVGEGSGPGLAPGVQNPSSPSPSVPGPADTLWLEIGAGTGVLGLAVAELLRGMARSGSGAVDVVVTDIPPALALLEKNVANYVAEHGLETVTLACGELPWSVEPGKVEVAVAGIPGLADKLANAPGLAVLAGACVYEADDFPALLCTLATLCAALPLGAPVSVVMATELRGQGEIGFFRQARGLGWNVRYIEADALHPDWVADDIVVVVLTNELGAPVTGC
ncbi:uncharacterized protein AMSG_04746 [Thecamonas trahens ATCC 50062]|uniref:Nicotinamide N-methyltransferase n=1 Tax=Thecamonas trahens ATCC 50062 TaxID=461836 RepID=A0A0L0DCG8_THETB|nr:hypothetical protein AMSG_04746 [Thecamonas trahens ATCC 50062]KNC49003.1 hypothetical protein AMSG_04746 [Thecamonas trahens ATCC 50062]|eukprot:XP_013758414.1 hypothetical protein AMSG_04746 [Thecamonas trahens ATCC 50062]